VTHFTESCLGNEMKDTNSTLPVEQGQGNGVAVSVLLEKCQRI